MLLEQINRPADLKRLDQKQLAELAEEIRQRLLDTVTRTGGHLASNLGVVELTIALHHVFNSPEDQIVWDVGHQSYVHKLLTGRRERFDTLRQYGGLSGFPSPEESPHDVFGTGHASTSISAALGLAVARNLKGDSGHVIAVIGDGAMTGGMAYEGLNNAGQLATRFIVVLNDNEMSISRNVGAIAKYLNRMRSDPRYYEAKMSLETVLLRLPLGRLVLESLRRIKNSFKGLFMPTMIWEDLGFTYLGPVDGHDLPLLQETFRQARTLRRPVLVHVLTKKGKGYGPAEDDAVSFHGVPPNGGSKPGAPTYTSVFANVLVRIARADPRVVAITAAMPDGTGLIKFAGELPHRFFDVGIAEQHAVTFAAGLARRGLRPVVAVYSTFLQRAYDQVVHDVCMQNLPVVFAVDRAGIVGDDGRTHQGPFDLAYLRHIPQMVVMAPRDENELQHMLYTAFELGRPVAVRYPRGAGMGIPLDESLRVLPLGEAEVLREGVDLVLLAVGRMVHPALAAADLLAENGIRATVVNARYVKPLDADLILSLARRVCRLVTLEEGTLLGGFGSAVAELLLDHGLSETTLLRIGLPDEFVDHGAPALMRHQYGLDPEGIARRLRERFPELARAPVRVAATRGL